MITKLELPAVRDTDLTEILQHYGYINLLDSGKLNCKLCQKALSFENIGAIQPSEDILIIYCDDTHCLDQLSGNLQ